VKRNLDPLIFRTGREITMAGVLTGTQKVMMGGVDYTYPVFEAKEIQLRPEERYPVWRDPFYYPYPYYWYDPYWNRPFLYP
jgi:outer membrane lipoprotein